jgi:hypothetical protein
MKKPRGISLKRFTAFHATQDKMKVQTRRERSGVFVELVDDLSSIPVLLNLQAAKKLHAWLGRYIEWRENK